MLKKVLPSPPPLSCAKFRFFAHANTDKRCRFCIPIHCRHGIVLIICAVSRRSSLPAPSVLPMGEGIRRRVTIRRRRRPLRARRMGEEKRVPHRPKRKQRRRRRTWRWRIQTKHVRLTQRKKNFFKKNKVDFCKKKIKVFFQLAAAESNSALCVT